MPWLGSQSNEHFLMSHNSSITYYYAYILRILIFTPFVGNCDCDAESAEHNSHHSGQFFLARYSSRGYTQLTNVQCNTVVTRISG